MKFKKNIGFVSLMFTAVGGIVGSGWLFGPFYAAQFAGPASILAWLIGGALMMVIALTFAELATLFPVAGGTVRFTQFTHGSFASFTMAWISWLAAVIVAPIETMAALQYAANYFPLLAHSVQGVTTLTGLGILVAAGVMLLMCALNVVGIQFFTKTNNVIVLWKLIIPAATICVLLSTRFSSINFTHYSGFFPYGWKGVLSALPAAGVIFSFIGYSPAIQLAAEAKNPQRAIPYAIIIAIAICIFLYMGIEVAFIGAVGADSLTHGWRLMSFAGDAGPVAGILSALGLVWFVKLLYIDAVISPFGTAYIYTTSTARINYGMSMNGYMPEMMRKLTKRGSPMIAILTNFVVGMIFFLPFPGWQAMVGFLVSCFVIAYAVGPISCVSLRYLMPGAKRSFRLPAVHFTGYCAFYICNLIIYWTKWDTVWRMLLTIMLGYIFLFGYRVILKNQLEPLDLKHGYWLFPYFLGIGFISYLGAFGGRNIIPFGWDFVVIALFSLVVFYWAILSRKVEIDVEIRHARPHQIGLDLLRPQH